MSTYDVVPMQLYNKFELPLGVNVLLQAYSIFKRNMREHGASKIFQIAKSSMYEYAIHTNFEEKNSCK